MMLDMDARYSVRGRSWEGVAVRISGFPKRWEPFTSLVVDDETGDEHEVDTDEGEWVEQDESCGRVIVVMVGDDQRHEVDVGDLTPLAGPVCSCGQIGCSWGDA
jgi:hypothetical protein